jgi:hypothetical protein
VQRLDQLLGVAAYQPMTNESAVPL